LPEVPVPPTRTHERRVELRRQRIDRHWVRSLVFTVALVGLVSLAVGADRLLMRLMAFPTFCALRVGVFACLNRLADLTAPPPRRSAIEATRSRIVLPSCCGT
jgi:hypothetical protein